MNTATSLKKVFDELNAKMIWKKERDNTYLVQTQLNGYRLEFVAEYAQGTVHLTKLQAARWLCEAGHTMPKELRDEVFEDLLREIPELLQ